LSNEYLNNRVFEAIIERYQKSQRERAKYELIIEDIDEAGGKPRTAKRVEAKQARMAAARVRLEAAVKECKECERELAYAFYTLAEEIVQWRKFTLIDEDDAVQEGVLTCFEKVARFDPAKGSAFNYLTTCVLNHYRQMWRTARNYNELKIKYQDFLCSSFEESVARSLRERLKSYRAINTAYDGHLDKPGQKG
jgi:hypothetical protein